jgi:hypothetical protein
VADDVKHPHHDVGGANHSAFLAAVNRTLRRTYPRAYLRHPAQTAWNQNRCPQESGPNVAYPIPNDPILNDPIPVCLN